MTQNSPNIINEETIEKWLRDTHDPASPAAIRDIISKAKELKGLDAEDIAKLASIRDPELLGELFQAAKEIKEVIYGNRMVIFSPLYISNLCQNECLYCAFRAKNKAVKRRALSRDEVQQETKILINQG
ncbi:MAG: [FeFe] hydrogenase H-cluster radical SAM maturase HydG, partial [Planctomycetota bacterium]